MNAVWSLTRYNTSQNFLLKKFLKENSVSRNLSTRILRRGEKANSFRVESC